jgi:hypothetical protein
VPDHVAAGEAMTQIRVGTMVDHPVSSPREETANLASSASRLALTPEQPSVGQQYGAAVKTQIYCALR